MAVTTVFPKDAIHVSVEPYGIATAQHWYQIPAYFEVIRAYGIDTVVEIGSFRGGLLTFIGCRAIFQPTFRYLGIEFNEPEIDPKYIWLARVTEKRVSTWVADAHSRETIARVSEYIRLSKAAALVLCDGYSKGFELALYNSILRSGDIIAAHDFGVEIFDNDFDCLKDRFVELRPELFRDACGVPMWICQ